MVLSLHVCFIDVMNSFPTRKKKKKKKRAKSHKKGTKSTPPRCPTSQLLMTPLIAGDTLGLLGWQGFRCCKHCLLFDSIACTRVSLCIFLLTFEQGSCSPAKSRACSFSSNKESPMLRSTQPAVESGGSMLKKRTVKR